MELELCQESPQKHNWIYEFCSPLDIIILRFFSSLKLGSLRNPPTPFVFKTSLGGCGNCLRIALKNFWSLTNPTIFESLNESLGRARLWVLHCMISTMVWVWALEVRAIWESMHCLSIPTIPDDPSWIITLNTLRVQIPIQVQFTKKTTTMMNKQANSVTTINVYKEWILSYPRFWTFTLQPMLVLYI